MLGPAHDVELDAFYLDRVEATVHDYAECVRAGACSEPAPMVPSAPRPFRLDPASLAAACNWAVAGRETHPMNCIAWSDADRLCRFRGGRLPTEAEWEFAARGTTRSEHPWGDAPRDIRRGNFDDESELAYLRSLGLGEVASASLSGRDGFGGTAPGGSFPGDTSPFGILDMAGNVSEWTSDRWEQYVDGRQTNPRGPARGDTRVWRGASWLERLDLGEATGRGVSSDRPLPSVGVRCAYDRAR